MAKQLQVLLLENVTGVGSTGDIVAVSEGYARNALFPDGRAALATEQARSAATARRAKSRRAIAAELARLQELADQLDGTELTIAAQVKEGEGNDIFGRVTTKIVAEKLAPLTPVSLKPKDVKLPGPITELGTYDVVVKLSKDVETELKVTVVPEED